MAIVEMRLRSRLLDIIRFTEFAERRNVVVPAAMLDTAVHGGYSDAAIAELEHALKNAYPTEWMAWRLTNK